MVNFKQQLESATAETLLETDLPANLRIIDIIRAQDVSAKDALKAMRKRLSHKNPNVVLRALEVLEMAVKNCGGEFQAELATQAIMDELQQQLKSDSAAVRQKYLELLQLWAHAFKSEPSYKAVCDTYNILRMQGQPFPEFNPMGDAMFVAERPPEWKDGNTCFACRRGFTTLNRRHHCRNCGNIFCGKCSSKEATIPRFGIEKKVRVCDTCASNIAQGITTLPGETPTKSNDELSDLELMQKLAQQNSSLSPEDEVALALAAGTVDTKPPPDAVSATSDAERKRQEEEEQIQLALALSLSEADAQAKHHQRKLQQQQRRDRQRQLQQQAQPSQTASAPPSSYQQPSEPEEPADPMAAYIAKAKQKREQLQAQSLQQTAGPSGSSAQPAQAAQAQAQAAQASKFIEDDSFLDGFGLVMTKLEDKLKRAMTRGGGVAGDPNVKGIHDQLTQAHAELLSRMDQLEDARDGYLDLHELYQANIESRQQLDQHNHVLAERAEQQRQEQEAYDRMMMEQKMKLIEQQRRDQQAAQMHLQQQRQNDYARAQQEQQQAEYAKQMKLQQMMQSLQTGSSIPSHAPPTAPGSYGYAPAPPQQHQQPMPQHQQPMPPHQQPMPQHQQPMPQHQPPMHQSAPGFHTNGAQHPMLTPRQPSSGQYQQQPQQPQPQQQPPPQHQQHQHQQPPQHQQPHMPSEPQGSMQSSPYTNGHPQPHPAYAGQAPGGYYQGSPPMQAPVQGYNGMQPGQGYPPQHAPTKHVEEAPLIDL